LIVAHSSGERYGEREPVARDWWLLWPEAAVAADRPTPLATTVSAVTRSTVRDFDLGIGRKITLLKQLGRRVGALL
jgi:hypothetical protein